MNVALKDIDFSKVRELGDQLLDQIDALRETDPILWSERQQSWIVTGYTQVTDGFRGKYPLSVGARMKRIFQAHPDLDEARIPTLMTSVPKMLVSLDPPEQVRLRKLMMKAFSRTFAEQCRPFTRKLIAGILDEAEQRGDVEFVEEVAHRIPGNFILNMMGLSSDHLDNIQNWSAQMAAGLVGGGISLDVIDRSEAAARSITDFFKAEIAARRAKPTNDFISALIEAEEDGERLTDDEIAATCQLTLGAGIDTTTNTIVLGTVALSRDAEARAYIRAHPEAIADINMEIMRYVAMSTGQVRVATDDFDWDGHSIKKGDHVYLMIVGGNRDPSVFPHPDKLDLTRDNQAKNLTFGPGLHFCIGHYAAKMQLSEFFPALVERFERIEVLDEKLDWGPGLGFRGLESLNVRLVAR
jgi:pimeloyl-[acyl-carrier protein] synthase